MRACFSYTFSLPSLSQLFLSIQSLFRVQWFSTMNAHWNHLEVFKVAVPESIPREPELITPGRGLDIRISKSHSRDSSMRTTAMALTDTPCRESQEWGAAV